MKMQKYYLLSIGFATALAVAGCGSGDSEAPAAQPAPPEAPKAESFTNWSKNGVFAKPAEGTPEVMDTLVWNFDGDNDPAAYADLLPPAT